MRRPLLAVLFALCSAAHAAAADTPTPTALCPSPEQAVDLQTFVPIGGIEQWVTVRGARCGNPIVLVLHGGPGNPLSPYADALFAGWSRDFTLVQWDQRGAGRTFGRNPAAAEAPLSLEQMSADGVAVAAHVAGLLGQQRVILLGGSWGAALAVHMAKASPERFHAYVGAGQLVRQQDNLAASLARVTALATAANDRETLAMLDALGPLPWRNPRAFGQLRRATRRYEAKSTTPAPPHWWQPAPAYATPAELAAAEAGEEHSYLQFVGWKGDGLLSRIDLPALGPEFAMPVHLVQGEEDLVTTADVARRWFDSIKAPHKSFDLLPATGHDPNPAMIEAEYRALQTVRERLQGAAQ